MSEAPHVGPTEVLPFRPERNATLDTLRWAKKRLTVSCFAEIDVTAARKAVRAHRRRTGHGLSFTAWIVTCVARAAADHPRVHALRRGKRELVVFQEVDVAVIVERGIGAPDARESLPMPCVVRNASEKSAWIIHEELRAAQARHVAAGAVSVEANSPAWLQAVFFRLPTWLRDLLYWRWLFRSPARIKRTMGTIVVTATGMATPGLLAWGIPVSMHALAVGIGGITDRETSGEHADVLALSLVFDHAVTDGAPVGRFLHRLNQLITDAYGLSDLESARSGS